MDFAFSGAEALQRVTIPSDVQLILLLSYIKMPEITGLELLPKVRELCRFLRKPIDFDVLREEVTRRLHSLETTLSNKPWVINEASHQNSRG
jgi:CheY-like chemotaxis protein